MPETIPGKLSMCSILDVAKVREFVAHSTALWIFRNGPLNADDIHHRDLGRPAYLKAPYKLNTRDFFVDMSAACRNKGCPMHEEWFELEHFPRPEN